MHQLQLCDYGNLKQNYLQMQVCGCDKMHEKYWLHYRKASIEICYYNHWHQFFKISERADGLGYKFSNKIYF
jgi:hypothetical protein